MLKDPNKKINNKIAKLAKKKSELLRDKFKTDDQGLRKIWDNEIQKIDRQILELQAKLK